MSGIITDEKLIDELISRGAVDVIVKEDLKKKLMSGKQLRIKHGIDPTGPKIHIGRASTMRKLGKFQELGHKVVLIIGDFTGQVGDSSDKDSERPMLTEKQVRENMKDYLGQFKKVFDADKAEVRYNSEWLGKLNFNDICKLADNFSVAEMIDRENFSKRFKDGKRISLREFLYPLMQGYDSVAVEADVEIGGTDQLFNILAGRTLQKAGGQEPQNVVTFKLLEGTDGRKMSTSWGNVILIEDKPNGMFGKVMSIRDELIEKYFEICTDADMDEVRKMISNPRDAKIKLASEIVKIYHGEKEAKKAKEYFEKVFSKKEMPDEVAPSSAPEDILLIDLMVREGLAKSNSDAKRKIEQGGVKIGDEVVKDYNLVIGNNFDGKILKVGKREFRRIALV